MPVGESRSQGSAAGGRAGSRRAIIGPNEYWRINITSSVGKSVKLAIKDVSDVCCGIKRWGFDPDSCMIVSDPQLPYFVFSSDMKYVVETISYIYMICGGRTPKFEVQFS
jgi:hypothetical protein